MVCLQHPLHHQIHLQDHNLVQGRPEERLLDL
jgi:hypothetical protein